MIEIEYDEPNIEICDCCGNNSFTFTRYVSNNEKDRAVYLCHFIKGHVPKIMYGVISIGDWSEKGNPSERIAFPFMIKSVNSNLEVMMAFKDQCPWRGFDILGKMLDREESLKHQLKPEVFQIINHIVIEDETVIDLLD